MPCIKTVFIQQTSNILQGSRIYTDDPQNPGNAMARKSHFYKEDFEEDFE